MQVLLKARRMKELLEMLEKCVSSLLTEKVSWSTSRERKVEANLCTLLYVNLKRQLEMEQTCVILNLQNEN